MKIVGTKLVMDDGFTIDLKSIFDNNYKYDPGFRPLFEPGGPEVYLPCSRVASAADSAYRMARKSKLGAGWVNVYIPEFGKNWMKIIKFANDNASAWVTDLKNLYPILKTNLKATGAAIDKIDKQRLKLKAKSK